MKRSGWTLPAIGVFSGLAGCAGLAVALNSPQSAPYGIVVAGMSALSLGLAIRSLGMQRRKEDQLSAFRTQTELMELEIVRHRQALDELADGLDVVIFLLSRKGVVMYANEKAKTVFQYSEPEDRTILAVTLSQQLQELVVTASATQAPQQMEVELSHPEARTMVARAWGEGEEQTRIFLSLVDITELRKLETIRKDFVANVSHELRTPMATMRAMAETLQDEADDQELRDRYLALIIHEVDRLTSLTDDLLVLSTAEGGNAPRSRVNLSQVALEVIDQIGPSAREKNLELIFDAPAEAWSHANEAQMHQMMLNLVANAINYTPQGEVELQIRKDETRLLVVVRDTGIGIASEHLPRVFERFYRVDRGRSRSSGGTGLGLSIVRHIVEAHQGRIHLESTLHQGTTFTVDLPVAPQAEEAL